MNQCNLVHLEGTIHGQNWSRYKRPDRGQVRFWLAVSRDLAGEGYELLLCAIEPKSADEIYRLERELGDGRSIVLNASAHSLIDIDRPPQETSPGVIFIAEEVGLAGGAIRSAHSVGSPPRRHHAHGKMAAAGDDLQLPDLEATG